MIQTDKVCERNFYSYGFLHHPWPATTCLLTYVPVERLHDHIWFCKSVNGKYLQKNLWTEEAEKKKSLLPLCIAAIMQWNTAVSSAQFRILVLGHLGVWSTGNIVETVAWRSVGLGGDCHYMCVVSSKLVFYFKLPDLTSPLFLIWSAMSPLGLAKVKSDRL